MSSSGGTPPGDAARRPETTVLLERRRMPGLPLAVVAWVVASASVALVTVPVLDAGPWPWVTAGLAVVAALGLAIPAHRRAVDELSHGRITPELLGSVGLVVAAGASVAAALGDRDLTVAVAATVPAALALTVFSFTGGITFLPTPSWFVPAVVVVVVTTPTGKLVTRSLKFVFVTRPCCVGSGDVDPVVRAPVDGAASRSARTTSWPASGNVNVKVTSPLALVVPLCTSVPFSAWTAVPPTARRPPLAFTSSSVMRSVIVCCPAGMVFGSGLLATSARKVRK